MKIDLFKKILIDNRRLISQIDFIERDIVLEDNLNYVFVGLRQAGKSYLMYQRIHQLLKMGHTMDEIIYVNLDDERLYDLALEDFR